MNSVPCSRLGEWIGIRFRFLLGAQELKVQLEEMRSEKQLLGCPRPWHDARVWVQEEIAMLGLLHCLPWSQRAWLRHRSKRRLKRRPELAGGFMFSVQLCISSYKQRPYSSRESTCVA